MANPYTPPKDISSEEIGSPEGAGPTKGSLLVIFLTVFIDLLGFAMVLPLLPIYAKQFGVGERGWLIGLLMASFSAMQFLFAPAWGRLSDRIGRRPVLIVGLLGSTVFYALFGVATIYKSLLGLFLTRIGAGIAGATISTAQAYIADTTTLKTRAKGMALIGAAFGLGFTLGPLVGAAALLSSYGADAATRDAHLGASPWPGFAAAILSGVALLLAIFILPESLKPGKSTAASRRIIDMQGLRDALSTPTIGVLLLTSFISVVAFGGFETTLGLLLKSNNLPFQYDLPGVLAFYSFIGVVLTFAQGLLVRRLSGRVPEMYLITAGGVCSLIGFLLMMRVSEGGSLGWLMIASAVEVTGFAMITPPLASLVSRRSDPAKQGGILGVSQSVSSLARIIGPIIAIPLFTNVSPSAAYGVSMVLMTLGMIFLALKGRGGTDYGGAAPPESLGH